jgi:hypothetical protein
MAVNEGDRVRITDASETGEEYGVQVGDTGFIEVIDFLFPGSGILVVHFDERVNELGAPLHQMFKESQVEVIPPSTQYVEGELVEPGTLTDPDILIRIGSAAQFAEDMGQAYLADWLTGLGGAAMVSKDILAVVRKLIEG